MKNVFILLCFFLVPEIALHAQMTEVQSLENELVQKEEMQTNLSSESSEEIPELEQLEYLRVHPMNLNTATADELIQIPFLTEQLISDILIYRNKFGSLISIEELQVVGLPVTLIRSIRPFVDLRNEGNVSMNLKTILDESTKTLTIRAREKETDMEAQTSYPGSSLYLKSRFRLDYKNKLSIQFKGEKDPGENFFSGYQKNGFDFYSAYASWRGNRILKQVILGDYCLQYGQGLLAWSGMALGGGQDAVSLSRQGRGIVPYQASDENNFLRGAAVALAHKKFATDFFISRNKIDARLDTLEVDHEPVISSVQQSGYHRTSTEVLQKDIIALLVAGSHISYRSKQTNAGFTILYKTYPSRIEKASDLYHIHEHDKTKQLNLSMDYKFVIRNVLFFSEIATYKSRALAGIAGCMISLAPALSVGILHRNYSPGYYSEDGNSFSENSSVSNEQGTCLGLQMKLKKNIILNSSIDVFRFPWLRYRVAAPSSGSRLLFDLTWNPSKTFQVNLRMTQTNKQENPAGESNYVDVPEQIQKENYRCSMTYRPGPFFEFGGRTEFVQLHHQNKSENGILFVTQLSTRPINRIKLSGQYAIYETASYGSRVYTHLVSLPGVFSIAPLYGNANRFSVVIDMKCIKKIELGFQYVVTIPSDGIFINIDTNQMQEKRTREFSALLKISF